MKLEISHIRYAVSCKIIGIFRKSINLRLPLPLPRFTFPGSFESTVNKEVEEEVEEEVEAEAEVEVDLWDREV